MKQTIFLTKLDANELSANSNWSEMCKNANTSVFPKFDANVYLSKQVLHVYQDVHF